MTRSSPMGAIVGIRVGTCLCLAAATTVIALAAITVTAAGLAEETRRMLGFGFGGVDPSPAEAARIALHNGRVAGGTLLCAALAPRLTLRTQRLVFLVLTTVLVASAAGVGIAIGAYGTRVVSAIAIHLPVEFSALSLAGGAYMQACKQALSARELSAVTTATGLLLAAAAALETYVSIGGTR
jgi:hypothetical protein